MWTFAREGGHRKSSRTEKREDSSGCGQRVGRELQQTWTRRHGVLFSLSFVVLYAYEERTLEVSFCFHAVMSSVTFVNKRVIVRMCPIHECAI